MADATSTPSASIATALAFAVAKDIGGWPEEQNGAGLASGCDVQTSAGEVSDYLKSDDFKALQALCEEAGFHFGDVGMSRAGDGAHNTIFADRIHRHANSELGEGLVYMLLKK